MFTNGILEGCVHVHGDDFNLCPALGTEHFKKRSQGVGALAFRSPNKFVTFVIHDHCEEFPRTAVADFINSDELEIVKQRIIAFLCHHSFGDLRPSAS